MKIHSDIEYDNFQKSDAKWQINSRQAKNPCDWCRGLNLKFSCVQNCIITNVFWMPLNTSEDFYRTKMK